MYKTLKEYIDSNIIFFTLAAFGGLAVYLNTIRIGKRFKLTHLLIYIIVSGWFGMAIQDFIPNKIDLFGYNDIMVGDMRYSITSILGGLTLIIFDYLESNGIKGMLNLIKILLDKIILILNTIKGK